MKCPYCGEEMRSGALHTKEGRAGIGGETFRWVPPAGETAGAPAEALPRMRELLEKAPPSAQVLVDCAEELFDRAEGFLNRWKQGEWDLKQAVPLRLETGERKTKEVFLTGDVYIVNAWYCPRCEKALCVFDRDTGEAQNADLDQQDSPWAAPPEQPAPPPPPQGGGQAGAVEEQRTEEISVPEKSGPEKEARGMDQARRCTACGGGLTFMREAEMEAPAFSLDGRETLSLYLCSDCGRYELYKPSPLDESYRAGAEEQKWMEDVQEKVRAGVLSAVPFLCPTCGNLRRDRTCPICGSVVDLKSMEEVLRGDPNRK